MEDSEVVAAILAGDPAGLGEAYDRYATPLYAYCRSMLREPADAADAVQDTFVIAVSKVRGLRDPGKLRAWLYAVARNQCLRQLHAGLVTSALDETSDVLLDPADAPDAIEQAELRELVRDAIDGLNPGERDILELSLRHALDGGELAAVLGVSRNHANALLSRARSQLERSLGALLVARTGRQACPVLSALLTGWDEQLTVLVRKRVCRHIERCDICGERKRRELTPALLAGVAPLAALLPAFRDQVMRLCTGHDAASAAHRASVQGHAGSLGSAGFPKPLHPPGVPAWHHAVRHVQAARHSHALVAGAATSATAAAVIAVVVIGVSPHHGRPPAAGAGRLAQPDPAASTGGAVASPGAGRTAAGAGLTSSATGIATGPGTAATPTALPSPAVAATPLASSPAASPSAAAQSSAAPSSAAPSTASPSSNGNGEGTLTLSTSAVTLVRGSNGTATGTFTLTATGGPIHHYQINVGSAKELSVSPSSGSLAAGASVTIAVTTTSAGPLSASIIVNPSGNRVAIQLG
jgi:RNA polymerase sigma factor (sigma-70 family)